MRLPHKLSIFKAYRIGRTKYKGEGGISRHGIVSNVEDLKRVFVSLPLA